MTLYKQVNAYPALFDGKPASSCIHRLSSSTDKIKLLSLSPNLQINPHELIVDQAMTRTYVSLN